MTLPESTYADDHHRHVWEDGAELVFERFTEKGGDISAEVTVRHPLTGLAYRGRLNLLAPRSLKEWANKLETRSKSVDWDGYLTAAAHLSVDRYREGEPIIDLMEVEPSGLPRFLIPPLVEGNDSVSLLYADGGTGKSMLALALAVTVATGVPVLGAYPVREGPVVYLDWEADPMTFRERLDAICKGAGVELGPRRVFYQRQYASMRESATEVRKKLTAINPALVVVDSIGLARGGAPESAEETIRLFLALRQLGAPVLAIDHISKEAQKTKAGGTVAPFGSVYSRNSARLAWSVEKAQEEGADGSVVLLTNTKSNNGRLAPKVALKVQFVSKPLDDILDAVYFERTELKETQFKTRVPIWMRMRDHIRDVGQAKTADLAVAVECEERQVRVEAQRHPDVFQNVGTKAAAIWALRITKDEGDHDPGSWGDHDSQGGGDHYSSPIGLSDPPPEGSKAEDQGAPPW